MAVVAEATNDEALRLRIREAIVDRQKHLVLTGRKRAQQRGELPPDQGPVGPDGVGGPDRLADPARDDLIFDVIAGAVVHRLMVSSQPVDDAWAESLAHLLVAGLAGLHTGRA